ncbi:MAG: putative ABC transport system permease protein [bacterium F083]|nr:MAG: putative ABC transport system permease protein [bacterium F083]
MSSYIKFLSRNKLYTIIEAIGLIVSIAFVILIGNYVYQQYSVAYGNPYRDRVYAVGNQDYMSLSWWDKTVFEDKLPEAETVARISGSDYDGYITFGDEQPVGAVITEADPEIFELFPSLTLLEGSVDEYRLKGHCLISESLANRAFNGDAVGKPIRITYFDDKIESMVCGVFKDAPNSMMPNSDVLLNPKFNTLPNQKPFSSIGQYMTLIKVREGTDREQLAKKVEAVGLPNYSDGFVSAMPIYTLPEVFFNDNQWMFKGGKKPVMQTLTVVVLLLLVSAIFNYINLNMALSGKRAKEMATRRLHGATKGSIIMKYIVESVLFTAVCFVLSFLLACALFPMINGLLKNVGEGDMGIDASFVQFVLIRFDWSVGIVAVYLAVIVLVGVLAGIAPAAIASRFEPIDVVRGTYRLQTKRVFSKIFIVFQNTITIVLIAMAILMEVQMRHMMNRPTNMRSEGLYSLQCWVKDYSDIAPLIDRLEKIPNVNAVGYGRGFAGQMNMGTTVTTPEGERVNMQLILCDETYFNMLDLQVVEDFGLRTNSVWMSRTLAEKIALSDSTAHYYTRNMHINGSNPETVGGIYEDIPTRSAASSEPNQFSAVIIARAEDLIWGNGVMIDVLGDYKETEKAIMQAYADYSEEKNGTYVEPAQNGYVKDLNNLLLQPAKMAMRLLELFMLLSVLISLLGLVAMSTYYSEQSTKSIAVRKVFGSNVHRELWRTVKDYMVLAGIAALIGIPLAVWFCGRYLDRFAYRIEHYGWIIAVAAILGMLMAFLSVLWQTLRAARTNPAEALKKE